MADEILKFTKLTLAINFAIALIYTILYWLPETNAALYGVTYTEVVGALNWLIGSCMTGLTLGSLFGIFAKEWKEVRIVLIILIAVNIAFLITLTLTLSVFNELVYVAIVAIIILLVLYCLSFLQQEDTIKILWK